MTVRYVFHDKAKLGEKVFRLADDALPVLKRAGRVIGDDKSRSTGGRFERQAREVLGDVAGEL
jgi:hypothetical protein